MINLYDRIKEVTYTIGTGNFALSGVVRGSSSFSSVYANSGELFYTVTDGVNYEIGSGLYLSSVNQIRRFPIKSTNSNNLVSFTEGLKEIYVTYPATNAVFSTSGLSPVPQNSGLAFWTSANSLSYNSKFVVDSGNGRLGINKSNPTSSIDIGGPSSSSNIKASGFIIGNSGVYFPSGNNGLSSYSGGVQLTHYEMNQTDVYSASVIQLSGAVNQNILLKKQNAGTVFAGPPSGCSPPCSPGYPNFRPLTIEDIPDLSTLYGQDSYNVCNGRMSISSGNPVIDGSSTSLFFVPYNGNSISLYNGTNWVKTNFNSTLIANFSSLSAETLYDVFAYNDGGILSFELQPWSMTDPYWEEHGLPDLPELSRIVPLVKLNEIWCKSTNTSRRYIGTIKTTSSGFANTTNNRLIYNCLNKVPQNIKSFIPNNISLLAINTNNNWYNISQLSIINIIGGDDGSYDTVELMLTICPKLLGLVDTTYELSLVSYDVLTGTIDGQTIFDSDEDYDLTNSYLKYNGYISGTYKDEIANNITAYLKRKSWAFTQIVALHKTNNSIISIQNSYPKYGIIGTYSC